MTVRSFPRFASIWLWVGASLALGCGDPSVVFNSGSSSSGAGAEGGAGAMNTGGTGNVFVGGSGGGGEGGAGGATPDPYCGDGRVDPNEVCDDANAMSGDGCTGTCDAIENNYACPTPGQPCILTVVCGDGRVRGTETCNDANIIPGDGCSSTCAVEAGWRCLTEATACVAASCGDGILAGDEECEDDDNPPAALDGCDDTCQLEPGFKCDVPGSPCVPTDCGDAVREGSEQCDDGDNDMGDGCTPRCLLEPTCVGIGPCTTTCGDGIKLPGGAEQCEDGNTEAGDGCSPQCTIEPGFNCMDVASNTTEIVLPIVLRDFKIAHPDFENFLGTDLAIVQGTLGADAKPQYTLSGPTPTTSGAANFNQWYNDVAGVNLTILQDISLGRLPTGVYQYNNSNFFPINGLGFGNEGNSQNFHFTSEVRYWFEYSGGEQLNFTGDDDVWVFVNKQLTVNLGGVHGAASGGVVLDAAAATTLGLTLGSVYEIVVFQAERHTTQSNYRLTLGNFDRPLSLCTSICGDGIKTPDEQCDDGINDGAYGHCTMTCGFGPYCGDNITQMPFEECDDGINVSPYGGCAPGCVEGAFCGDGIVDSLFGEQCDDGANDGGYNQCAPNCRLGERCGDGVVQAPTEECDDGNTNNNDSCNTSCDLPD